MKSLINPSPEDRKKEKHLFYLQHLLLGLFYLAVIIIFTVSLIKGNPKP